MLRNPGSAQALLDRYGSQVAIVVLLRDPSDRAVSNWHHSLAQGREDRGFAEALNADYRQWEDRNRERPDYEDDPYRSYFTRSLYRDQMPYWRDRFANILVVTHNRLVAKPQEVLAEVTEFLQLSPFAYETDYQMNSVPLAGSGPSGAGQDLARVDPGALEHFASEAEYWEG